MQIYPIDFVEIKILIAETDEQSMPPDGFGPLAKNRSQTISARDECFERWIVGESEAGRRRGKRQCACLPAYILCQGLQRGREVTDEVKRVAAYRKQHVLEGIS